MSFCGERLKLLELVVLDGFKIFTVFVLIVEDLEAEIDEFGFNRLLLFEHI
jgi:hypothetical protein